ncbi:MAG: 50S ribosomal protein L6 [Candidatus Levyibacteriota bacterium]
MANNVGKKPVELPVGVTVAQADGKITVTGSKGALTETVPTGIEVNVIENVATIKKLNDARETEKFAGLMRALLANMVQGVSKGFEKKLELTGVGYRARTEGNDLVLNVGFANTVRVTPPQGITITANEGIITVAGSDKAVIGDLASKIREIRIPDPYKAKGIKYVGERIRRKVGKAAKAVGGK